MKEVFDVAVVQNLAEAEEKPSMLIFGEQQQATNILSSELCHHNTFSLPYHSELLLIFSSLEARLLLAGQQSGR